MKRLILASIIAIATIALATPAMACPWWGCVETDGIYSGYAYDIDGSMSVSHFGYGNDYAGAIAEGTIGGTVRTSADGFLGSFEHGSLNATVTPYTSTHTNLWDFGTTSYTSAYSSLYMHADAFGVAGGFWCGPESVRINLNASGYIGQRQVAREVGYNNNQGIIAGNNSSIEFNRRSYDSDYGRHFAIERDRMTISAVTYGSSFVTIDPYGPNRSMYGATSFNSSLRGAYGHIMASGGVQGLISDGNSSAYGSTGFNVNGMGTNAGGNSVLNATIMNNGLSTTVSVSGSSSAGLY